MSVSTLLADLNGASAVCLAVSVAASVAFVYFLLVDAVAAVSVADFDPRPVVRRALESGHFDRLLIAVADARYLAAYRARHAAPRGPLARRAARDAAISVAALLALLLPAHGGTR